MPVDKWTDCAPSELELVSRVFRKQLFIITPDRPENALVNAMGIHVSKSLSLAHRSLLLLALVLLEHLLGRA